MAELPTTEGFKKNSHLHKLLSLVAPLLLIGGCGAGMSNFEGTWSYTSGNTTITCPNIPAQTSTLSGDETLAAAASGNGLEITNSGGCNVSLTVSGSSATASAGQTCSITESGTTWTATLQSWTFTTSDGKTATETVNATISGTVSGQSITCTVAETGALTKVSK